MLNKIRTKTLRIINGNQTKSEKLWKSSFYTSEESLGLKEDDVFLVSFPRSGNTWMRNIIANIQYSKEYITTLKDLNDLVPDLHKGIPRYNNYSSPRIIKTHRSYPFRHVRTNKKLYKKIIYIVRNPINVTKSLYNYQSQINPKISLNEVVTQVITGNNAWGGSWQDHVLSWKAQEDKIDILFIKYEDLLNNQLHNIQKIANFIGYEINSKRAEEIKFNSSKEVMKVMDDKGKLKNNVSNFIFLNKNKQSKIELTFESELIIKDALAFGMNLFNYDSNI